MNMHFLNMLLFTFLINTLLLPHYEKCRNNNYNISLIQNNIQGTTIQSRLLAQTKNHNPHYHNDPEPCECTDINGVKLAKTKGRDKYLKNLKHRCIGGICSCSVASAFLTMLGFAFAKTAALGAVASHEAFKSCLSSISIFSLLDRSTMLSALQAGTAVCAGGANDMAGTISTFAMGAFYPYGIAALVLILIVVVLIILYIWMYRRRKNSWKHECKKHLCK
ncbi:hypothetical protein PFAG_01873 [Plasmodium falciparum Santa Lucia]|uniref:Surface antigen n=1 Tax=Plasmodium falciparum Santa Lucia TaxID=478859 RepID=W7FXU3_PLAFA|nr:hypothetical protein PFAG_01873 [Plasmodium falciparum Santa Lucia]